MRKMRSGALPVAALPPWRLCLSAVLKSGSGQSLGSGLCLGSGLGLAAMLCVGVTLGAQQAVTAATVTGEVLDPSGARVPGAVISATAEETGVVTRAEADGAGRFRLLYLQPGRYLLRAEVAAQAGAAPGSQSSGAAGSASAQMTAAVQRVDLQVGASVAVTLKLGGVQSASTVAVRADAVTLETNRSQQSEVVAQREFEAVPFAGRNYLDAALLVAGVSSTNTASTQQFAETASVVGQGYSVNSQRNLSNSVLVDGLSANDDASGLPGYQVSQDAVQELQVVTSGAQAEFGRALGGFVNVLTRGGDEVTHGTVFALLRNRRLDAADVLSRQVLPLTQVEAGASAGGALQRGKTFGFGSYELRRLNATGVLTILPADAAAVNARLDAVGYAGTRLPVAPLGGGATLFPTSTHTDMALLRLDRVLQGGGRLNARWSTYQVRAQNVRGAGGLADVSYGTAVRDGNQTFAVSAVRPLPFRAWSETRAQYQHDELQAPPNSESPAVVISGVASFGRFSFSPTGRLDDSGELVENMVLERGAHALKLGADLLVHQDTITYPQAIHGSYTFASLAAFLSGTYNTGGFTQAFGNGTVTQANPNLGMYLQDAWRLGRRVTLNLGARWDLQWLETLRTDKNNVAPRVGVAWSPHEGTVVRASGGLFYDRFPLRPLANALLFGHNTTDASEAQLLSYTYSPGIPLAPVFPDVASAPPAGARLNFQPVPRGLQLPYSAQASAGVEQVLGRGSAQGRSPILGVSYQRVRGVHLLGVYNTNIRPDGTRPDPTLGNVKPYDARFDSSFDGLEVSLRESVGHARARVSYVWSKALDNVGEFFTSAATNNFDFSVDRGRSDDDQRHRVVAEGSVLSGTARDAGWRGRWLSGWELGGVMQYTSRLPFTLLTGANTLQQTAARPCAAAFYGTQACAYALRGALVPRNTGQGFAFVRVDARLSRTVNWGERQSLNFAIQSFNLGNHRNDMIPNATFGTGRIDRASLNPQFGAATAVGDARNLEVGVRYRF